MFKDRRFWTYMGLYGVLLLATLPLLLGGVPPNPWYGFRFPGASIDPEAWYAVNALGGRQFAGGLLVSAALNALVFWKGTPLLQEYAGWINAGLILLSFWLTSLGLLGFLGK